jgi:tetratricopeptide (TPR) repeat protein
MTHDQVIDRLSEYVDDADGLDGEGLGAAERTAIEAHLATCAECRTALSEIRAVVRLAANLPDTRPDANLWPGISTRLERPAVVPFTRTLSKRFSFTLPQLVAASLALMVLSGGMVWIARLGDPRATLPPAIATDKKPDPPATADAAPADAITDVSFADAQYDAAVSDLEKALQVGRSRLDPETVRILEENLASIDLAIEQSRKALRNDPANVYLNNHFAASRNRKLALLRRASALAMAQETSGG